MAVVELGHTAVLLDGLRCSGCSTLSVRARALAASASAALQQYGSMRRDVGEVYAFEGFIPLLFTLISLLGLLEV